MWGTTARTSLQPRSSRAGRLLCCLPPICNLPASLCRLQQDSLPFLAAPHDALRQGLVTLKDGAAVSHPVEQIQQLAGPAGEQSRAEMLRNVYGSALPARMQIEKQILDRCGLCTAVLRLGSSPAAQSCKYVYSCVGLHGVA